MKLDSEGAAVVAYNFSARFADAVERGLKRQTIRAPRKDGKHAKIGDKLQLFTGMRTADCRLLREAVCHDVCPIIIEPTKIFTLQPCEIHDDLNGFAKRDGFADWNDMRMWFDAVHELPFKGFMISWLVPLADRR